MGYEYERYAHYALEMYLIYCNYIVGSFVKLLHDLDNIHSSSHRLFHGVGWSPLCCIVLHGSEICLQGLCAPPIDPNCTNSYPPVLHFQLDNIGMTTNAGL